MVCCEEEVLHHILRVELLDQVVVDLLDQVQEDVHEDLVVEVLVWDIPWSC